VWTPNSQEVFGLGCGHYFHLDCLKGMINAVTGGNVALAEGMNVCLFCPEPTKDDLNSSVNYFMLAKLYGDQYINESI